MKKVYPVNNDFNNTRLDRWFRKNVANIPQSLIEKNLRKGIIKVNNKKTKSSYKLQSNDKVILYNVNFISNKNIKKNNKFKASKKDLLFSSNIIIENNENYSVINKPSGIAVQAGTKSSKNIIDIIRYTKEFKDFLPYTVHRIDKETSGILIVAKNRKFAQLFTSLFRLRKIYKTYLCVALGSFNEKKGTYTDELIYYEGNKKIKSKAITHFTVLDSNQNYSLLKLNPITGRKHQIRKQLLLHGHPILGDKKYRIFDSYVSKKDNLMLHAHKINFTINNIRFNYSAEIPELFKKTVNEKRLKIHL